MSAKRSEELVFGVWATAWGPMGGVRSARGLQRVVLPHYSPSDLRDLLAWEHPGARQDDAAFAAVEELCRAYFNRRVTDFSGIDCDLSVVGPFGRCVLETCRRIAYGQTLSYTALVELGGQRGKQRAAAQALGKNPIPLVIPCHRVIEAGGGLGGFSAAGGVDVKRRMLELEKQTRASG